MKFSKLIALTLVAIVAALACVACFGGTTVCEEHTYGEWEVTKEATCGAAGEETRTCTVCGSKETRAIEKLDDHSFGEWVVKKAAGCVDDGAQERVCSVCGKKEKQSIANKGGHDFGDWYVFAEATKEADGEERRDCSVCDFFDSKIIPQIMGVVIYENNFDDAIDADSQLNKVSDYILMGMYRLENWYDHRGTYHKTINLNNDTGLITITLDLYPNVNRKTYDVIQINDQSILTSKAGCINIGGEDIPVKAAYGTADLMRKVTVMIDPATGNVTVQYRHPDGPEWGDWVEATTVITPFTGSFKLSFRVDTGDGVHGFLVDNLKVLQAELD